MIPLTSPNDKKDYRALTLENGMRVLLISEPDSEEFVPCDESESEASEHESDNDEDMDTTEDSDGSDMEDKTPSCASEEKMAAVALCVGVGSFSDPSNSAGLAHYLEHMVFMGSERYPQENKFDSFIEQHGGSDNAYTDCERTNFYFEIIPKHLRKALDIFAQFFISPLMKVDSMDRELSAVNNEYQLALLNDEIRKCHVLASLAKEGHPMKKFCYGNEYSLKTLPEKENVDIYKQLQEFRMKLYAAQFMTLAVQAKVPLDTLEEWVKDIFAAVPNNGEPKPSFENYKDSFDTQDFYKLYKVIPVNIIHEVELQWVFPSLFDKFMEKPFSYLNYLISHEGKGSILSYLRKRVLALELNSECSYEDGFENNSTCSVYTISIRLTEEGLDHQFEVITAVLEYLEMIRREGPSDRIAREYQKILDNSFQWQEEQAPFDNVQQLSAYMHLYPVENYVAGAYKMKYDPELIKECLAHLTFKNMNIFVTSSRFNDESASFEKEKWFEVPYQKNDIDPSWKKSWESLNPNSEFHLPIENQFITTDFSLVQHPKPVTEFPVLVHDDHQSELWYKGDSKFKVPRGIVYYSLESDLAYASAKSAGMMDLFSAILKQTLETELYAAKLADLDYYVDFNNYNFCIKMSGFNQNLKTVLWTISDAIVNFDVEENLFNGLKNELKRKYHNRCTTVKNLTQEAMSKYTEEVYFTSAEKRKELESVTKSEFLTFLKKYRSRLYIVGLIQGNFLEKECIDLHKEMIKTFYCDDKTVSRVKINCMKMNQQPELYRLKNLNGDDSNSAVYNYYQFGPCNMDELAYMRLLVAIMTEPCFDILRTSEQLSYSVHNNLLNLRGVIGFRVKVLPNAEKFSCTYVDERIENFINEFLKLMKNLTKDAFNAQVESEIKILQQADLVLQDEADRNWHEILKDTFCFDYRQKLVKSLELLTLSKFQTWCEECLSADKAMRRTKLSLQIVGKGPQETINIDIPSGKDEIQWYSVPAPANDGYTEVVDIAKSKMSKEVYPEHKVL